MKYFVKQLGDKDCAFACVKMLLALAYKNKKFLIYPQSDINQTYSLQDVINIAKREGVFLYAFRFKARDDLVKQTNLPVLVPIKEGNTLHLILIRKIKRDKLLIYDPMRGPLWIDLIDFLKVWDGECLEIEKVIGSSFIPKKMSFIKPQYLISIPIFQLISFAFLILALLFIDKNYSFVIPISFFFAFVLFEFVYKLLLVGEMKSFDQRVFENLVVRDCNDLKKKYIEMNNFKLLIVSTPIQIINCIVIVIFGLIILGINSYLNILNMLLIFAFTVFSSLIEKKYFSAEKNSVDSYENSLFATKGYRRDDLKSKIAELHKRTYLFVKINNLKKVVLLFLIITISMIYCSFSGTISINFVLFHVFIYYYLSQNLSKFLEILSTQKQKAYYISLYQYYSSF